MPDAVRIVESVQGPEWVTVPWQAGGAPSRGSGGDVMMEDLVTDKMSASDKSHSEGLMPCETTKKKRRSPSAKKSAGYVGGSNTHSRHQRHLQSLSKP